MQRDGTSRFRKDSALLRAAKDDAAEEQVETVEGLRYPPGPRLDPGLLGGRCLDGSTGAGRSSFRVSSASSLGLRT